MGGRGTYAIGNNVKYQYETVGKINGVKVLQPIDDSRSIKLPEESHKSNSYIVLDKSGVFKQMRVYNEKHEAIYEVGYHQEKSLGSGKVLHVHLYAKPGDINHKKADKFAIGPGNEYFEKVKKYLSGVKI